MPAGKFRARFLDEASDDFLVGLRWYAERDVDVAETFRQTVAAAVAKISETPLRWPIKDGSHRLVLHGFPYTVAYHADENSIWIIAVAHHSREPETWAHRR